MIILEQFENKIIPCINLTDNELLNIKKLAMCCKDIENTGNVFSIFPVISKSINLIPKLYALEKIENEYILNIPQDVVDDCIYLMTFGGIYIKYNQFISYAMINKLIEFSETINNFLSENQMILTNINRGGITPHRNSLSGLFLQKYTHYGVLGFQKVNNLYPNGIENDNETLYIQNIKNYWRRLNFIADKGLSELVKKINEKEFVLLH